MTWCGDALPRVAFLKQETQLRCLWSRSYNGGVSTGRIDTLDMVSIEVD